RIPSFNQYYESISIIDSFRIISVICYFFNSESDKRGITPKYREYVKRSRETKEVYHLKSTESIAQFFAVIESQH
ncbi:MAG: hypothetical protein QNJ53_16650, partial [Pleurocapsa sp. MO_192.B19]|nr:hypothetical protein [Pleurocapsa sp. MO_192.B19]